MSIKTYRPVTKSLRQMTRINYREALSGHKPTKSLLTGAKRHGGRNSQGRITVRHQGGGHKQRHRDVDFKFNKKDIPAKITTIEYDPFRSAFIGLAIYRDGEKRYVVLPQKMKVGDEFIVSETAPIKIGNRLPLGKLPVGTFVYNIEIKPGNGGKIRSLCRQLLRGYRAGSWLHQPQDAVDRSSPCHRHRMGVDR